MATVEKKIADDIIAGKYEEDQAVKIVKYTNAWGGEGYGVIFKGMPLDTYRATPWVIDPVTYWERKEVTK